jgi:predicted DNA binding CopG/RHH family protein
MISQIYLIVLVLALITVIPAASAQLSLGTEANQKLIEVKLNKSEIVNVKHIISASGVPVSVNLFDGVIAESIIVTNSNGDENQFGLVGYGEALESITIFPSESDIIIKYNLEDASTSYENLWTVRIGYSETFDILFSKEIDMFFFNNTIIQLENKNGITANGGGNAIIQYYDKIPKIIEEVSWEQNKFDIEIITNSKIDNFNFNQESKNITFDINEKNKFLTISMEEELVGSPYVILLNNEKILYNKSLNKENYVLLSMKPQAVGEITISNSEYIQGLTEIISNDTLTEVTANSPNDYFIWLVLVGVLIIIVIVVITIMRKINK